MLVEYGEMEFDLTLNFFVLAVDAALRDARADGLIETAPGFRSILVELRPARAPGRRARRAPRTASTTRSRASRG